MCLVVVEYTDILTRHTRFIYLKVEHNLSWQFLCIYLKCYVTTALGPIEIFLSMTIPWIARGKGKVLCCQVLSMFRLQLVSSLCIHFSSPWKLVLIILELCCVFCVTLSLGPLQKVRDKIYSNSNLFECSLTVTCFKCIWFCVL